MRVIKDNTLRYQSFFKSLPLVSNKGNERNLKFSYAINDKNNDSENLSYYDELDSLLKKIKIANTIENILEAFESSVSKIISCQEMNIFLFDETKLNLNPVGKDKTGYTTKFINKSLKEGILDWVFETKSPKLIPALNLYKANGRNLNFLFFPLQSDKTQLGIVSILSQIHNFTEESVEAKIIRLMTEYVFAKIEMLKKNDELLLAYKDQQLYQSKLINDYKLSAIGELTKGISEEILSPLQVISSHIDLLEEEIDYSSTQIIKNQISKMESVLHRLIKFASQNGENIKIYPCDLNRLIEEYHKLLSSTLISNKYECVLNLSESLPPVLSNPDYINQLLANIFSIITSSGKEGGGILIQTKFIEDIITIRVIFTEFLPSLQNKNDLIQFNLRIIYNLMKKHEGDLKTATKESAGSAIVLSFPLKRKMR